MTGSVQLSDHKSNKKTKLIKPAKENSEHESPCYEEADGKDVDGIHDSGVANALGSWQSTYKALSKQNSLLMLD